jgi:hypothetical protein
MLRVATQPDAHPREDSNLHVSQLRRLPLCPLSYEGIVGDHGVEPRPTDLSDRPRHRLSRRPKAESAGIEPAPGMRPVDGVAGRSLPTRPTLHPRSVRDLNPWLPA